MESLDLKEANELRAKLGLKPLAVDEEVKRGEEPQVNDEQQAVENYRNLQKERAAKLREQELKSRLEKRKEHRELNQRFKGKTLGEEMEDELDDAAAWVERSRKRQKQLASEEEEQRKRKEKEQKESKQQYTDKDIVGLRVAHDIDDVMDQDETILVLKDSSVLDGGDEDGNIELVSVGLLEKERLRENAENKSKKIGYDAYDDSGKSKILSQYDSKQKKAFTLGDNAIKQQSKTAETTSRAGVESLDYSIASEQNNDYYSKDEYAAQFKKKKTKKRAIKKQVMNEDEEEIVINDDRDTLNFVDDHDLQAALARSRRQAVEKPKPSIQELAETLLNDDTASSIEQRGHLEVSETTEFVQKLLSTSLPAIPESKVRVERNELNVSDDQMDVTVDNDDDDSVNINHHQQHNEEAEQQAVKELIEEPTVDGGMASTLKLLKQKGLIEKRTEDDIKRDQLILEHQKWAMKRKANATAAEPLPSTEAVQQRRLTRREEVEREQQRAKELEEKFKDYKPVINLVYRDEFGRALSQKEAYKQLSHKFHGKQPGKQKTEKRLKRIAEEMAIQRAENSSLRGIESIAERQKEAGAAHLLLSSASAGKGSFAEQLEKK